MALITPSSPHIHTKNSVTRIMLKVVLAMVPAMITLVWFFGWGLLIHSLIAITTALFCEAAVLYIRKKPVIPALMDGSALVTALLIAFCIPQLAPWWTTFLGTAFTIIIAKQLYGGLGLNPFNPAMIGYVMLLISFPREMTAWLPSHEMGQLNYGFTDIISFIFSSGTLPDSISMASPLDNFKTALSLDPDKAITTTLTGQEWIWINSAFLLGGIWLLYKKIIQWHIPVAVISSLLLFSIIFFIIDNSSTLSPLIHLFSGATMIGAFFIATDPVTASTTIRGRLIYGAGIGALTFIIRTWGGYPDAIAFAVLLMNIAVPTIDYYTRPETVGRKKQN